VVDTRSPVYQGYLLALASLPTVGLWFRFDEVQKVYAVVGALFIPILALALLVLNGSSRRVGRRYRNAWLVSLFKPGVLKAGWGLVRFGASP